MPYVIVWEFRARSGMEEEFIRKYGPEGAWAKFFRRSDGYIRTELVRDVVNEQRFLTLDYWKAEEAFDTFHRQNRAEYKRLDKECESLTERERRAGASWFEEN